MGLGTVLRELIAIAVGLYTQQNPAGVETSAAAAMSLQEQSRRLVDSIDAFGNAH